MKKGTHVFFAYQYEKTGHPNAYIMQGVVEKANANFCEVRILDRSYMVERKWCFEKKEDAHRQLVEDLTSLAEEYNLEKKGNLPGNDIAQTVAAEKYVKCTIDGKRTDKKTVLARLGDRRYWTAIHRAAFHRTAALMGPDGKEYGFDCRDFFKQ